MYNFIFSHFQVQSLFNLKEDLPTDVEISTDLGVSRATLSLSDEGLHLPDGSCLPWNNLEKVAAQPNGCFTWNGAQLLKVSTSSELTGRQYSLYPTAGAPTMLVSGIPMHRVKGTTPDKDTREKIKAAGQSRGKVLDTCTGLGYSAIAAARTASHVLTIELDPQVIELARLNPWSAQLFDNERIEQRLGDSSQIILELEDGVFTSILHDPPTISLAGELYGLEFYRQLYRVLRPGGKLFHYIGDLDSTSGMRVTRGVTQRLRRAGFDEIQRRSRAFGVTAIR